MKNRDETYIRQLVKTQEENGADYLDVCAGTSPEEEYAALCWLIGIVENAAVKPICVDSPNPNMIARVFPLIKKPGIINSISGEGEKCTVLLPLLKENPAWQVIALCCNSAGIAAAADDKVRIAFDLIAEAEGYGISPSRIHIDPLVLALSAVNNSALQFCEAIERIKEKYPTVNIAAALSNISFGMPARGLINANFLTMAMVYGLDTVIADPGNRRVIGNIFATEALLDRDRYCRKYNTAFRAGRLEPPR
ncbi:MAG: dihydropteroate synthase [Spirochaetia bacterium]|nr:dihydropteroate synthase [Spirochaetia bacterium]